jgi:hypothetical protein
MHTITVPSYTPYTPNMQGNHALESPSESVVAEISKDVWALSSCDMLVGTASSSVMHVGKYGIFLDG